MNEKDVADRLAHLLENHLPDGDANGPASHLSMASAFGPFSQEDYKVIYFRLFAEMVNEGSLVPWDALALALDERHGHLSDEKVIQEMVLPDLIQHWIAWSFMWKHRRLLKFQ